jgi:hypothetical protein
MKIYLLFKLNTLLKENLLSPLLKVGWGVLILLFSTTLSAQFGTGGTFRNAKSLPSAPKVNTILAYNDTIWVYTGTGGWKSLYEAGYPDATEPSVLFYDTTCACWTAEQLVDITDSVGYNTNLSARVNFTATNINNGDVIEIIPAPGTGKVIHIKSIVIHTSGTTSFAESAYSYIRFGTYLAIPLTVNDLGLDGEYTTHTANASTAFGVGYDIKNLNVNIDFDDSYYGGARGGWIEIEYDIYTE